MPKLSAECLRAWQNSQLEMQTAPKPYEELESGITTRVMAFKMKQREEQLSDIKFRSAVSLTSRTTSSRFLQGVSMPNSIVRSESNQMKTLRELDDKNAARAKRDQFVQDLITRVAPRLSNQFKKDNDKPETNEVNVGTSPTKLSVEAFEIISEEGEEDEDDTEKKLKESRRVTRRTSSILPYNNSSRPTLELLQQAIQNTPTIRELVNVDNLHEGTSGTGVKKMSPIPSMVTVFSNLQSSLASNYSKTSKHYFKMTKTRRASVSFAQKPMRSSILKDSSKPTITKPYRSVSINETKREDSQTQTYLKMMHIKTR